MKKTGGIEGTINVDQTRDSKLLVNIDYKYTKSRIATKTAERVLPYCR